MSCELTFRYWLLQVSLSSMKGTGPDGSIIKADVEEYLGKFSKLKFYYYKILYVSGTICNCAWL